MSLWVFLAVFFFSTLTSGFCQLNSVGDSPTPHVPISDMISFLTSHSRFFLFNSNWMIFELQIIKPNLHLEICYRRGTNVETDVLAEVFLCKIPLQSFGPTALIFMRWTLFRLLLFMSLNAIKRLTLFLVFILMLFCFTTTSLWLVVLVFCANLSRQCWAKRMFLFWFWFLYMCCSSITVVPATFKCVSIEFMRRLVTDPFWQAMESESQVQRDVKCRKEVSVSYD